MALPQQHFWGQVVGGPTYCPVGQSARSAYALYPLADNLPRPKPWDSDCSLSSPLHFALCGPKPPSIYKEPHTDSPPLQLLGVRSSCSWGAIGKSLS